MSADLDAFMAKCRLYEGARGSRPIHEAPVRDALNRSDLPFDSRLNRARKALEATLLFVLKERGGDEWFHRGKRKDLNTLVRWFKDNGDFKALLVDQHAYETWMHHADVVRAFGNEGSHFRERPPGEREWTMVSTALGHVVNWAWSEVADDCDLDGPSQRAGPMFDAGGGADRGSTQLRPDRARRAGLALVTLLVVAAMSTLLLATGVGAAGVLEWIGVDNGSTEYPIGGELPNRRRIQPRPP